MQSSSNFILSAPWILPIDQPLIQNGSVVVEKNQILDLGSSETIKKKYSSKDFIPINLPQTVLLPGFVNAHSHLELTSLKKLEYPGNFTDWIRKVVEIKPQTSDEDYQKGIQQGIDLMLQSGITTVGDHVSFNTDLELILKSPLRGILFIEILGVVKEVAEMVFRNAEKLEPRFQNDSSLFQIYASPHSVHAVHPEILPKLFSNERKVLSIHLGESKEEKKYFRNQSGPLYNFIANRRGEAFSPNTGSSCSSEGKCFAPTAIQLLESQHLLSDQVMAVHCNYLDEKDFDLLEKYEMSIVHCPSSHDYFSHQKFNLGECRKRNINIALGTDSLASGESLSILDQIRLAKKTYPDISAEEWIKMATLNGAKALKMENEIGSITKNKKADIVGFKIKKENPKEICAEILLSEKAHFMMLDGKIVFDSLSPLYKGGDEGEVKS